MLSDEFKPWKKRIIYKAGKLFPQEMRIVAKKEGLKRRERLDPKVKSLLVEIADLEEELKRAEGRIRSGRVPSLIPRDKKLVEELRERIRVLKGQLSTRKEDD